MGKRRKKLREHKKLVQVATMRKNKVKKNKKRAKAALKLEK